MFVTRSDFVQNIQEKKNLNANEKMVNPKLCFLFVKDEQCLHMLGKVFPFDYMFFFQSCIFGLDRPEPASVPFQKGIL